MESNFRTDIETFIGISEQDVPAKEPAEGVSGRAPSY